MIELAGMDFRVGVMALASLVPDATLIVAIFLLFKLAKIPLLYFGVFAAAVVAKEIIRWNLNLINYTWFSELSEPAAFFTLISWDLVLNCLPATVLVVLGLGHVRAKTRLLPSGVGQ
jgi:hypothetical protein